MIYLFQGGFFHQLHQLQSQSPSILIRDTILDLCKEMKNDAVALIDAIAPPDYVLDSALGESTGLVYQNIYKSMIQSNGSFERINFIDDFMKKTKFGSLRSKL
jgi:acyl-CoA oxidase